MSEPIRLLVVDDDKRAHDLIRRALARTDGMVIVGELSTGTGIVSACRRLRAQVVLMDVCMPDINGAEATRRIRRHGDGPPVLALTAFSMEHAVLDMVRAGASGFLYKSELAQGLVPAVHAVARGEGFLSPAATPALLAEIRAPLDDPRAEEVLTPRELTMLRRVGEGMSNRAIAEQEGIAESTVKTHLTRVLEKLGVQRRSQLVRHALLHGFVSRCDRPEPDRRK